MFEWGIVYNLFMKIEMNEVCVIHFLVILTVKN